MEQLVGIEDRRKERKELLQARECLVREYGKQENKLWLDYMDAVRKADIDYAEAEEGAWRDLQDALAQVKKAYKKAIKAKDAIRQEDCRALEGKLWELYRGAIRHANDVYREADERAKKTYNEALAPIREEYERTLKLIDRGWR